MVMHGINVISKYLISVVTVIAYQGLLIIKWMPKEMDAEIHSGLCNREEEAVSDPRPLIYSTSCSNCPGQA